MSPLFIGIDLVQCRGPGRHSITAVSSGVASMRTGKRLPWASSSPSPRGQDKSQRCSSTGRSKASPTVLMAAASCWSSSLKAAFWSKALPAVAGDGAGGVLGEQVLNVLGDELESEAVLAGALGHADHEGRALGVLHDRPHLVHHQQPWPGVLGGGGPHRLGADHRGGGTQFRLQQVQVEDGDQCLVGQQVVALVGEEMAQAAGGEGTQQVCDSPPRTGFGVAAALGFQVGVESRGSRCAPGARRSSRPGRDRDWSAALR